MVEIPLEELGEKTDHYKREAEVDKQFGKLDNELHEPVSWENECFPLEAFVHLEGREISNFLHIFDIHDYLHENKPVSFLRNKILRHSTRSFHLPQRPHVPTRFQRLPKVLEENQIPRQCNPNPRCSERPWRHRFSGITPSQPKNFPHRRPPNHQNPYRRGRHFPAEGPSSTRQRPPKGTENERTTGEEETASFGTTFHTSAAKTPHDSEEEKK